MSETKKTGKKSADPNVPLPDPEKVQHTFETALERFRERPNLYIGMAVVVLVAVAGVLYAINAQAEGEASRFGALWQRCEAVREKLLIDRSARAELAELESYLDDLRGTPQEGHALWYLAIYHYREAWTPDKSTYAEREPHLEKALGFLEELKGERFDELLLAMPRRLTGESATPIDELHERVEADLEFAKSNAQQQPEPAPDPVAVLRTSAGDIHLQFFSELAPKHTENFITIATKGTYNETLFHFVRKEDRGAEGQVPLGVMGGDPLSFFYNDPLKKKHILRWGNGGLGFEIAPERARFRIHHGPRIVTSQMRENADWNNAAQFMIMVDDDPTLDKRHTPFAKVVEGFEVVREAAARRTAAQHPPYKDEYEFTSDDTRNLVVEPVILHKVIVYRNRKALEHGFALTEAEKSLDTVSGTPVQPLPTEEVYCGRKLRSADDLAEELRPGLDIPFPEDVDEEKASAKGEWKRRSTTGGAPDGEESKPDDEDE